MQHLKRLFGVICSVALLAVSCSKKHYPESTLKKQLVGKWELISYGGGFANLRETRTEDTIVVEFTPGNVYRNYKDDVLNAESKYAIKPVETAGTVAKYYVLVLKGEAPYIKFTVSETELVLAADHADATYFKYRKITD